MNDTYERILSEVLGMMTELAGDWEYSGEIGPRTRLLADLGMESLDLVVLGTNLQERFGRLPFTELLAELGRRPPEERDMSVHELVDFVCRNSEQVVAGDPR